MASISNFRLIANTNAFCTVSVQIIGPNPHYIVTTSGGDTLASFATESAAIGFMNSLEEQRQNIAKLKEELTQAQEEAEQSKAITKAERELADAEVAYYEAQRKAITSMQQELTKFGVTKDKLDEYIQEELLSLQTKPKVGEQTSKHSSESTLG